MNRMKDLVRPVHVEPREGYTIWIRFNDGQAGEIDLSDLAGKGVFRAWLDRKFFESVHLPSYRSVSWPGELDLCADMLYMRLTGKSYEEMFAVAG